MERLRCKSKIFYVYEHWRSDTNQPFWVGKGHDRRAYKFRRNQKYNNIVAKLSRLGMCVEVRMIEHGLPEHEAFALEIIRIAFWRSRGVDLTNLTDGGEGTSGRKFTVEQRKKIGDAHRGKPERPFSAAHRKKLGDLHRGKSKSAAHRKKLGDAQLGRYHALEHVRKSVEARKRQRALRKAMDANVFSLILFKWMSADGKSAA